MRRLVLLLGFIVLSISILTAQVKINEVLYNPSSGGDMIELKNFGPTEVNVTNWNLCARLVYERIGDLTVESGTLAIPAGGILVLSGKTLNDSSSDLGLYHEVNTNADFASASFMEDFVQWGNSLGAGGRESVAVTKGIWNAGEFVTGVEQGHSIEYDGDGNAPGDWGDAATPTLGSENSNVTSVAEPTGNPYDFNLEQNFPNPFNPGTIINYSIPQSATLSDTRLDIFNVLGQKVKTLVRTEQPSGAYTVQWDGTDDSGKLLANGVYVYRLRAGKFVDMKTMLFLK